MRQDNAGPGPGTRPCCGRWRGRFLSFQDADDLWLPHKIERQLARFDARPDLAYCVALVENFWEDEVADERERLADHARSKPMAGYVTQSLLVRREWMETTGGFDASLGHGDAADWFQRADAAGASGELVQEVLTRRRLHRDNRSRTMATQSRDEFFAMLKKKIDRERGRTS